ncbi:MAG: hypothetical protein HY869_05395 [Chloroflexi bacterium]|nr:hypothetical protein [Chloroflexota bacterium]
MKRKRGAQAGNRNAYKHGFYSAQFKQAERQKLSQIQGSDLSSEVEVIRVQILRYLEAETLSAAQIDYETRLQALRAVSLAAESITRLMRTQAILNIDPKEDQAQPHIADGLMPQPPTEP